MEEPEVQGGDITDVPGRVDLAEAHLARCEASVDRSGARRALLQEAEPQVGWEAGKALTQSDPQEAHPADSQASARQGGAGPR